MELSYHAKLRYVQRIIGIRKNIDAKEYLLKNEYKIAYDLLNLFNESSLFYKNYSPEGIGVAYNYYIKEDILIVVNQDNTTIITLYHIFIDSDKLENKLKIRENVKDIRIDNEKINSIEREKLVYDKETHHIEYMIDKLEKQLEELRKMREESIDSCVKLAAITKEIRMNNRKMMDEIMYGFKKFR